MRALVSGATGFVGSRLVRRLLAEGWTVDVIVRSAANLEQRGIGRANVYAWSANGNVDAMREIIRQSRPDVVFHLASLFLSEHEPGDVERLIESNVLFGTQLVEGMSLEGVSRLINAGTTWQHYGNVEYSPVNLYAATKQAMEVLLQYYVEARALRVITLELTDTYGPEDSRKKLIKLLVDAARSNREMVMSPGEQELDLVHVDDVSRAFIRAAHKLIAEPISAHLRFAVSSGSQCTLRALVREVERAFGTKLSVVWGGRPYRSREVMRVANVRPVLPGWKPEISLQEGLRNL